MLRTAYDNLIATTLRQLESGEGVAQLCYETLMRYSLSNGCIALILGDTDDTARTSFAASAQYALKLVGAPGARGGGVRSYDLNLEVSEKGSRITSLHERVPSPGSEKLSIEDYHRALIAVACFGERAQYRAVASISEDVYRNPDATQAVDYWAYVRAWKALLIEDETSARREMGTAMSSVARATKAESRAAMALLERDKSAFGSRLKDAVADYKNTMQKEPNNPLGVVYLPGLMLCRMAIDRGIPVEDMPYLPVRLLANYKPLTH